MALVEILMERDGLSRQAALAEIADCRAEMLEAIARGDAFEAEEIFTDWFGLEPDYLFEVV